MYDISKDSNPEIFNNIEYGLPVPNNSKLQELCLIIPHVLPTLAFPIRFSEFIDKFSNTSFLSLSQPNISNSFKPAMYDISKDSNPEIFNNIEYGLPVPNNSKLQELCLIIPHVLPTLAFPIRFSEFIDKFSNTRYPYYFIFAVLSVGIKRIKTSRTQQDKTLETLYAQKSLELMKLDKSFDPLIIWACCFVVSYSGDINDYQSTDQALNIATRTAKIIRLYQMDINSKTEDIIQKYSKDELEFRRRVWWTYYEAISYIYIFYGNFITFEQRDIVVNLPRNDFKWRYGGDIGECTNSELKLLNHKANFETKSGVPRDYHYFIVNITSLYKNIVSFVTKRWRKDRLNEDQTNLRLVLYINKLQKFKNEIDKVFKEKSPPEIEIYIEHKKTIKLILDTENYLFGYLIKNHYYNTLIYLYQSELIRDFDIKLHPGRVQAAKKQCMNASVEQMNLVEPYIKFVPTNYQESFSILTTVNASSTFTNFFFINDSTIKEKYIGYYERMVSIYNSFQKSSEVISSLNLFIKYIIDVKTKANEQNKKLKHLHKQMKSFSVSESDVDPWIAPKYGSPFHFQCCGEGNFSILDIGGYLEEKVATNNIFNQDNYANAYELVIKSPIIKTSSNKKYINNQLGKTNEYILGFENIPVIKQTVLLESTGSTDSFINFLANVKQESLKVQKEINNASEFKKNIENEKMAQQNTKKIISREPESDCNNQKIKRAKVGKMNVKNLLNDS
ncbi:hypothetical protein BB558_000675 [Smittium angustum]|uniref:Transcription factor domain-containing protein n=1 Tax=Smittium angustum TaxID=133377 RepID=A0A2U1JDI4_SMIAN|nr:hypothetical protein BB558_000675 [Smittium angustum]